MSSIRFYLNITSDQFQAYYQGIAKYVHVRSEDGRTVKFPASEIQKFLTHNGIQGRFEITFDEHNKLQRISRLS